MRIKTQTKRGFKTMKEYMEKMGYEKTSKVIALLNNTDKNANLRENKSYTNVDVFNRWKGLVDRNYYNGLSLEGQALQVTDADLRNIDLSNTKFYGVSFAKSNLEGANFSNSNFDNLSFIVCNLKNANFTDVLNFYKLASYGSEFENQDLSNLKVTNNGYEHWNQRFFANNNFKNVNLSDEQKYTLVDKLRLPEKYVENTFSKKEY